ncbi:hypothetical protein KY290_010105 [Solanum tuberosum]|uniref:Uncharacterized protein n=1 Tax=Solanum tuberosum TaxID=4113 RepID=A0ABQ7VWW1_SOLTU|nr:hypothetical protein KY289_010485 [Solanum tuberosum]KAH0772968.1 hypothetical protein KY290_010105 [Solanum tuberosum]
MMMPSKVNPILLSWLTVVFRFSRDQVVTGSSRRNNLLQKCRVSIKQFSSCELQGSCGLKILVKGVAFLLTESKVSIMVATKLILVKEKHLQDPILMFNNVFMRLESNAKSCLKVNLDKTL